jgi:arylsulfatase
MDFSEANDRADDEPDRLQRMRALWDAEAQRNNVLPISDGLVDRFGGFIPPTWPAGPSRTFRPGGGPVADESVPLLWGGFDITADIDTDRDPANGVVFALGDWFGGYALYLVEGRAHFTFARAGDALELATPTALGAGRHELTVSYAVGADGAPGRMVLRVAGADVDGTAVEGMLPLAVQHGGAGLRLGWDSGFPVSARYAPPARFEGTVHGVRVDTPGSLRPDPHEEVRAALRAD